MTEKKTTKKSGKLTISAKAVGATAKDIKAGRPKPTVSKGVKITRDPATGFTTSITSTCDSRA